MGFGKNVGFRCQGSVRIDFKSCLQQFRIPGFKVYGLEGLVIDFPFWCEEVGEWIPVPILVESLIPIP